FVSRRSVEEGTLVGLGLARRLSAVRNCRGLGKRDLKLNDALPKLEVDPETYEVRADGELLRCEPAARLPLAQRHSLFWWVRARSVVAARSLLMADCLPPGGNDAAASVLGWVGRRLLLPRFRARGCAGDRAQRSGAYGRGGHGVRQPAPAPARVVHGDGG